MKNKEKHEFALFIESLSALIKEKNIGSSIIFSDEKLVHRIKQVLRLDLEDTCVFFDRTVHIVAIIAEFIGKKSVSIIIQSKKKNIPLQPTVTFLLPILKRDDFESALYALTEMGVSTIQLVFTQKTTQQWIDNRDRDRAERILISAAEQSKNFVYPELKNPAPLLDSLNVYEDDNTVKIFFDSQGKKLFDIMQLLQKSDGKNIVLLIGPEGDLVLEEKKMVQVNNFIFCALTPTIMRAVQAAALGAGFVRSIL